MTANFIQGFQNQSLDVVFSPIAEKFTPEFSLIGEEQKVSIQRIIKTNQSELESTKKIG